jgi:hypothetical protein
MTNHSRPRQWLVAGLLTMVVGCPASPESGRGRGGGAGADVRNVPAMPLTTVPSKITDTKDLTRFRPRAPVTAPNTPDRAGSR